MLVAHRYANVHRSRDARAEQQLMNNRHSRLLTAFDLMVDHCVTKLRYHGVRSARLRHKRVKKSASKESFMKPKTFTGHCLHTRRCRR